MATVTLVLRKNYKNKNQQYPLVIRICDGKKQLVHSTGYNLKEHQFKNNQVVKHEDAHQINSKVSEKLATAKKYIADCRERNRQVDFNLIFKKRHCYSFIEYLQQRSQSFRERGMVVMRQKADRFIKELKECFGELHFDDINRGALEKYNSSLQKLGNSANTRHKKFEFLGKFFQDAIRDGKAEGRNPFRDFKIKTTPVQKEKLTASEIAAIEKLPISGTLNDARNLFLFSYYSRGMRFENCVTLKKENIKDGRIVYRANKGKKIISIQIHSRLQKILNQYKGEIIFPYLKTIPEDPQKYRSAIGSMNAIVNRDLKDIAEMAGIKINLSMHIARHSFAYHLKYKTDSIHVIKDSLGHSNTRTTEYYLQSLDDQFLDKEMEKLYGV
jgi:site-specific recombinase XerD